MLAMVCPEIMRNPQSNKYNFEGADVPRGQ